MVPSSEIENQIIELLAVESDKLVMICEPNKRDVTINNIDKSFEIKNYGGYLLNNNNKNQFSSQSPVNIGNIKLNNLNIINTINYLGNIPFSINIPVLKHLLNLVTVSSAAPKLYNSNKINELIKLNIHPQTKNLFKLTYSNKLGDVLDIQKHNSRFYSDKTSITTALLFANWCEASIDNSLYFNYFIDWRGSIYTNTSYFLFQGGELARSLLLFKHGQVLNDSGLEHLKIYTANCFGLDKLSIIITFALLVLGHGLFFLITHQIPFEDLGIDLHTFIGKNN